MLNYAAAVADAARRRLVPAPPSARPGEALQCAMLWLLAAALVLAVLAWLGPRLLGAGPVPEPTPIEPGGPDPNYALEIGDELDLHGVPGPQVGDLVDAFVDEAVRRGRREVKIVHGKGTGALRRTVRARLQHHPAVIELGDALSPGSGWGATVVRLRGRSGVAPGRRSD